MAEQGTGDSSSDRLRRSTRTPAKIPAKTSQPDSPVQGKRIKGRDGIHEKTPAELLDFLLTNSKSKLTNVEIANVINYSNFLELSEESQSRLCALLPLTAFTTYTPAVCVTHPDFRLSLQLQPTDEMDVDKTPATLDPGVFTSSFFLSAAHSWQDHLFCSWLGKKAFDVLEKFTRGARDGTLRAEWKDEVWEQEHSAVDSRSKKKQPSAVDLTVLAKLGLLQEGDVFVYKRCFPGLNITVEKDLLVDLVDPTSHAISFLLSPGTQTSLHPSLLTSGTREYDGKVLSMEDITDPVALERGVLDVDGRVSASDKFTQDATTCSAPHAQSGAPSDELRNVIAVRAWKSLTVWRWREDMREQVELQLLQERGGREKVATLYYLRGTASG